MRIVFYCQHVLGVGHVFRSLEIIKGLKDHEVIMVTGGAEVDFDPPANMTQIQLPGLMMTPDFKNFIPLEEGVTDVEDVLTRRLKQFKTIMKKYRPDVFMVELFPFGRKKFRFELLPILEAVNFGTWGPCKAVCSVRDILVEKDDMQRQVHRVHAMLNPNFQAVLVHSDPKLVALDETFPGVDGIVPEVHYTGYVARKPKPGAGAALREELGLGDTPLVVQSVGGGHIGSNLLRSTLAASPLVSKTHPHKLMVFTGPYATDEDFAEYQAMAEGYDWITVRRFTKRFPDYLDAADLSISLGGYNTTMNLLATGTYGLMYPFLQNREQHMRTERLEKLGIVKMILDDDLAPEIMAENITAGLDRTPTPHGLDLNGGENSGRILTDLISR
jgi:predicted glycosyltransferase